MRRTLLAVVATLSLSGTLSATPLTPARYVQQEIQQGRMGQVTIETINNLVQEAALQVTKAGYVEEATWIQEDWQNVSRDLANGLMPFDLGDHSPFNAYLAQLYTQLESILGEEVLRRTRLTDIKVINYAVPVVFDPRMENGTWSHVTPKLEYTLHFVPFAGTLTFWVAQGGCRAASVSSFICGTIASFAENLMKTQFGATLSDFVYDRATK